MRRAGYQDVLMHYVYVYCTHGVYAECRPRVIANSLKIFIPVRYFHTQLTFTVYWENPYRSRPYGLVAYREAHELII